MVRSPSQNNHKQINAHKFRYLIDWGLARWSRRHTEKVTAICGNRGFASPELMNRLAGKDGHFNAIKNDVWGLGQILGYLKFFTNSLFNYLFNYNVFDFSHRKSKVHLDGGLHKSEETMQFSGPHLGSG